jgi:hypothetical protein
MAQHMTRDMNRQIGQTALQDMAEAAAVRNKTQADKPDKFQSLNEWAMQGFIDEVLHSYGLASPILYEALRKYVQQAEGPEFTMTWGDYTSGQIAAIEKYYNFVARELEALLKGTSELTIREALEYGHAELNEHALRDILSLYKQNRIGADEVKECLRSGFSFKKYILEFDTIDCG